MTFDEKIIKLTMLVRIEKNHAADLSKETGDHLKLNIQKL